MKTAMTSRVRIVDPRSATGAARSLLDAVQAQLGVTPNFIRVLANSPKALEGFLGLYGALGGASLDKATQERIALAVAQSNDSAYCLAAHTALGRQAGLSDAEMKLARDGGSGQTKAAAVVALARALNEHTANILGKATRVDLDFPGAP